MILPSVFQNCCCPVTTPAIHIERAGGAPIHHDARRLDPCEAEFTQASWSETVIATLGYIAITVLAALVIKGDIITPIQWTIGAGTIVALRFLATSCNPKRTIFARVSVLFTSLIYGALLYLSYTGILPLKPVAIAFIAIYGAGCIYQCDYCAPCIKTASMENLAWRNRTVREHEEQQAAALAAQA